MLAELQSKLDGVDETANDARIKVDNLSITIDNRDELIEVIAMQVKENMDKIDVLSKAYVMLHDVVENVVVEMEEYDDDDDDDDSYDYIEPEDVIGDFNDLMEAVIGDYLEQQ